MTFYRSVGSVPRKRHTQHRRPDGGLYYEELVGEEGFSSDSSLLYHGGIPSALVDARPWALPDQSTTPNAPLLPRHLALHGLFVGEEWKAVDAVTGRRLVLANSDVRLSYVVAGETSPLYRNATGDECVYVEAGAGTVETAFGDLTVGQGDYVVLPRATTHRWVPDGEEPLRLYAIEANGHIAPPARYLSRYGQLLEHAPYCERDLRVPSDPRVVEGTDVEVYVKHRGSGPGGLAGSVHVLPQHPFDVVGWDGCLYPYALDIADFEPLTGRVHQPPPVHQV
ncbi:MAG: hmgA, partial [Frankiales bacterium]|nr:hmgA [Frankiales bacterium]